MASLLLLFKNMFRLPVYKDRHTEAYTQCEDGRDWMSYDGSCVTNWNTLIFTACVLAAAKCDCEHCRCSLPVPS